MQEEKEKKIASYAQVLHVINKQLQFTKSFSK